MKCFLSAAILACSVLFGGVGATWASEQSKSQLLAKILEIKEAAQAAGATAEAGSPKATRYPIKIHSHNDYSQSVPLYQAYAQGVYSIEVDMFYRDGALLVGHTSFNLNPLQTFESLYLRPLVALYELNGGRAWAKSDEPLQLVLELKSNNRDEAMATIVELLESHPQVFNPAVNPYAVRIVITGAHVPKPWMYERYPDYILFDGNIESKYTPEQLARVALFSHHFLECSRWNGKGSLTSTDKAKLQAVIDRAHALGKPIRFWGSPDGMTAWNTFYNMGVDYINTNRVEECADFFTKFYNKRYVIKSRSTEEVNAISEESHASYAPKLDVTTRNFGGFENSKIQLINTVETYTPSYKRDGSKQGARNIIFLIGDGMGLSQISAAEGVNGALSMLNMRYSGTISTSAFDAYTTDSAAGGSAFATGKRVPNRSICVGADSVEYPLITDHFLSRGMACGVVTMGNVADATPAAFYGHNIERDESQALARDLLKGRLSLLAGSGWSLFNKADDAGVTLAEELEAAGYTVTRDAATMGRDGGRMICIDEQMGKSADTANYTMLADITRRAIEQLESESKRGFFLMVEGTKIDYAGHAECFPASITETLAFDLAVAEALRYADEMGNTLVVVTGDHETGGLTIIDGDNETGEMTAYYVTDDHTPIRLPILAYGPRADYFIGNYDNWEVAEKMKRSLK